MSPTDPIKPEREIAYPKIDIMLCVADPKKSLTGKAYPLTAQIAKAILGWQEESENIKFYKNFRLTDRQGKKIRTFNNASNRPYYRQLAEEYMLEILRGKWQLNFETVKIDNYGMIHDGQHRLIGLVLAVQEWEKDRAKTIEEQRWQAQWPTEPTIDMLVCTGMDGSDEVVNTIGVGKFRSLKDVLYRCEWFAKRPENERRDLAGITRYAIEILYRRTGTKMDRVRRYGVLDFAPRFSHSEYLAFLNDHQRLLECIEFLYKETAGTKKLTSLKIRCGVAAGLLYLMATSATSDEDQAIYDRESNEHSLDWSLLDKAQDFWTDIAGKGKKTEPVTEALLNIPMEWGGSYREQLGTAYLVAGWNLFSDGEKITTTYMKEVVYQTSERGLEIVNPPRIGGIDCGHRPEGDAEEEE